MNDLLKCNLQIIKEENTYVYSFCLNSIKMDTIPPYYIVQIAFLDILALDL
jgi:hypothetical protein